MAKISVIVPVYNNEATVAASLQSLFVQSFAELEIIAVDDGSNDGSAAVLARLAAAEPRLQVVALAENGGVHAARAAGLRRATAPYVGFMDADDFVAPEMFQRMLQAVQEQAADIAICGIRHASPAGKALGTKLAFPRAETHARGIFERFCRLDYGTGSLCNKLYRRELLLPHALADFRWRQDVSEDTLVNIGCFYHARRVHLLREQLYTYVVNPASATRKADRATGFTRMLRAYAVAVDTYRHYGREILDGITELYAWQLRSSSYRVADRGALDPHEPALVEAVRVLALKYPAGLALLANLGWPAISDDEALLQSVKTLKRCKFRLPAFLCREILRKF